MMIQKGCSTQRWWLIVVVIVIIVGSNGSIVIVDGRRDHFQRCIVVSLLETNGDQQPRCQNERNRLHVGAHRRQPLAMLPNESGQERFHRFRIITGVDVDVVGATAIGTESVAHPRPQHGIESRGPSHPPIAVVAERRGVEPEPSDGVDATTTARGGGRRGREGGTRGGRRRRGQGEVSRAASHIEHTGESQGGIEGDGRSDRESDDSADVGGEGATVDRESDRGVSGIVRGHSRLRSGGGLLGVHIESGHVGSGESTGRRDLRGRRLRGAVREDTVGDSERGRRVGGGAFDGGGERWECQCEADCQQVDRSGFLPEHVG
mmetsp:Transcript_28904/g.62303  ORF Transcript_28904/g.62303 Transcript_28904/m.62303 type:complete len:320 (-) Transcript_28904:344-1303(-)